MLYTNSYISYYYLSYVFIDSSNFRARSKAGRRDSRQLVSQSAGRPLNSSSGRPVIQSSEAVQYPVQQRPTGADFWPLAAPRPFNRATIPLLRGTSVCLAELELRQGVGGLEVSVCFVVKFEFVAFECQSCLGISTSGQRAHALVSSKSWRSLRRLSPGLGHSDPWRESAHARTKHDCR